MGKKKDPSIEQIKEILAGVDPKIMEAFQIVLESSMKRAAEIGAEKGAEMGAKSVMDAVDSERRKWRNEHFRKRYANTRLLLQHYRSLNEHYSNAVWVDEDEDEEDTDEFIDMMEMMSNRHYSDTVIVDSIKKSSEKTRIIMRHVNKMLTVYKGMCEKSGRDEDARNWRIIQAMYLSPNRVLAEDIAEQEHIHYRTVYKCVDAAVDDLTMLLFGIDAIEKLGE